MKKQEKIRVGLIGAGWWVCAFTLPALIRRPDVEVVGVARLGTAELDRICSEFGIPYGTEDYRQLLDEVPMDAVVVSSPHRLHAEHALAAIKKGLAVYLEKPMTTSATDARRIVQAATESGIQILVPYGWNFQNYTLKARQWVAEGRIGTIRHICAQMATPIEDLMSGRNLGGTEGALFRPQADTWSAPGASGYGWGQLVHLLGALFFVSDLRPLAVSGTVTRAANGADIHDSALITCEGDVTALVSGSASLPPTDLFHIDIRIFGTEGAIFLDVERERLWLRRNDGRDETFAIPSGAGRYSSDAATNAFIDLLVGNDAVNAGSVLISQWTVEVVEAMLASAEQNSAKIQIAALGTNSRGGQ